MSLLQNKRWMEFHNAAALISFSVTRQIFVPWLSLILTCENKFAWSNFFVVLVDSSRLLCILNSHNKSFWEWDISKRSKKIRNRWLKDSMGMPQVFCDDFPPCNPVLLPRQVIRVIYSLFVLHFTCLQNYLRLNEKKNSSFSSFLGGLFSKKLKNLS